MSVFHLDGERKWASKKGSKLPGDLTLETAESLLAYCGSSYLVPTRGVSLERTVCNFLATAKPLDAKEKEHKVAIFAPPLGRTDYSNGELVSFSFKALDRNPWLMNVKFQLHEKHWLEDRLLWELCLHEFVATVGDEKLHESSDTTTLGEFWKREKSNLRKLAKSGELTVPSDFMGFKNKNQRRASSKLSEKVPYFAQPGFYIFGRIECRVLSYRRQLSPSLQALTRSQVRRLLIEDLFFDPRAGNYEYRLAEALKNSLGDKYRGRCRCVEN